ncbi:hypothetical protein F4861DRAFT_530467 [Xylaria intraflava]|nr:hypothetical protein F4861DRAFT_530467 [Xylaria intraflava]
MLQRRHVAGSQSQLVSYGNTHSTSDCEWKPFDQVPTYSGPHNLSRLGYDEEKCRNVLVRFCAHVPRNFQYKDGIQQIFLILRDHLGDENLDLAGGVLYELIEVDCEHTDDPGAAFQRWRHDHMYRYADLELPHIPHMTTITSSIIPTEKLARWRLEHPDRYRFVLSDSSPLMQRDCIASCIRSKKAWLIDHTLFVSTRSEGTHPIRSPNPKEFHEMQWDPNYGATGRLIKEREFPIASLDQPSPTLETADVPISSTGQSQRLRHSLSRIGFIERITEKLGRQKSEGEVEQKRRSSMPNSFGLDSNLPFKDKRYLSEITPVPLPKGRQIPNAIFARKFLIIDHGEALPSHMSISQMPTAESKATEKIVEAATTGLLNQASSWLFRGPFTPQLGFDGGLDYQWSPQTPEIEVRRFDLEASLAEAPQFDLGHAPNAPTGARHVIYDSHTRDPKPASKREGRVFDSESDSRVKAVSIICDGLDKTGPSGSGGRNLLRTPRSQPYEQRCQNTPLFNNIQFSMQTGLHNSSTPRINRKTTVVERPLGL